VPKRVGKVVVKRAAKKRVAPKPKVVKATAIADAGLMTLTSSGLDTLSTRRITNEDLRATEANRVKLAAVSAANENAPIPTMSSAPLATIAPRGVFLPDRVVVDIEGDTFPSTKLDEHGRDESVLPAATFDEVLDKAAEGQRLLEAGERSNAFRAFFAALQLLPQPIENWNGAGWLLVAMGECCVLAGDFARAFQPLRDAMHCPGTIGNPWAHLRLGQCRLEVGDDRAADELARAYLGGGRALFEDLDPKYFALVEKVLQPPPGHDRLP